MDFNEPKFSTILFVDKMMQVGEEHLRQLGYKRVTVPRIVPASGACENIDTLFEVSVGGDMKWFKPESNGHQSKRAYFAQTGQLYLEALLGQLGYPKLYCVGPSARAENAIDTRHLTEFEMVEIEFCGTFDDLLLQIEEFINALVASVKAIPEYEQRKFGLPSHLSHLDAHPVVYPKIAYKEAIEELGMTWGDDMSSAQEQQLILNHGGGPIFIVRYPNPESEQMKAILAKDPEDKAIKFFNMIPDPDDNDHVLSADCIVPFGGECVGSAARVWKHEEFRDRLYNSLMFKQLEAKDPDAKSGFAWYLAMLKKHPSKPHAGCGFGMSRIFQYLLAQTNITEVVTFPSNKANIH